MDSLTAANGESPPLPMGEENPLPSPCPSTSFSHRSWLRLRLLVQPSLQWIQKGHFGQIFSHWSRILPNSL